MGRGRAMIRRAAAAVAASVVALLVAIGGAAPSSAQGSMSYAAYADSLASGFSIFALSSGNNTANVLFANHTTARTTESPDAYARAALVDLGYNGDLVPLACAAVVAPALPVQPPGGCPPTPLVATAAYPSGERQVDAPQTLPGQDLGVARMGAGTARALADLQGADPVATGESSGGYLIAAAPSPFSTSGSRSISSVAFEGSTLVATTVAEANDVGVAGIKLFRSVRSEVTVRLGGTPGSATVTRSFEAVAAQGGLITLDDQGPLSSVAKTLSDALTGVLGQGGVTVTFLPGGEDVSADGTHAAGYVGGMTISIVPNETDHHEILLVPAAAEARLGVIPDEEPEPAGSGGGGSGFAPSQPGGVSFPGGGGQVAPTPAVQQPNPVPVPGGLPLAPPVVARAEPLDFRPMYYVLAALAAGLVGARRVLLLAKRGVA